MESLLLILALTLGFVGIALLMNFSNGVATWLGPKYDRFIQAAYEAGKNLGGEDGESKKVSGGSSEES